MLFWHLTHTHRDTHTQRLAYSVKIVNYKLSFRKLKLQPLENVKIKYLNWLKPM